MKIHCGPKEFTLLGLFQNKIVTLQSKTLIGMFVTDSQSFRSSTFQKNVKGLDGKRKFEDLPLPIQEVISIQNVRISIEFKAS